MGCLTGLEVLGGVLSVSEDMFGGSLGVFLGFLGVFGWLFLGEDLAFRVQGASSSSVISETCPERRAMWGLGSGLRAHGSAQGSGLRAQGSGFRVSGFGFKV